MSYTRREFGALLSGALAAGTVGGTPVLTALGAQAPAAASGSPGPVLDIADWSYYWYGVEHATLARGTVINGSQMYVEHWIPTAVRHPFAIVLIHGGYGQGTDWISTPDGRRGLGVPVSRAGLQGLRGRSARAGAEPASSVHPRIERPAGADLRRRRPPDWRARTQITRSGRAPATRPTRRSPRWSRRSGSRWPTTRSRRASGGRAARCCWTTSAPPSSSRTATAPCSPG